MVVDTSVLPPKWLYLNRNFYSLLLKWRKTADSKNNNKSGENNFQDSEKMFQGSFFEPFSCKINFDHQRLKSTTSSLPVSSLSSVMHPTTTSSESCSGSQTCRAWTETANELFHWLCQCCLPGLSRCVTRTASIHVFSSLHLQKSKFV